MMKNFYETFPNSLGIVTCYYMFLNFVSLNNIKWQRLVVIKGMLRFGSVALLSIVISPYKLQSSFILSKNLDDFDIMYSGTYFYVPRSNNIQFYVNLTQTPFASA